jgi:hypothetical protein
MIKNLLIAFLLFSVTTNAEVREIVQFKLDPSIAHKIYCFERDTGVTTVMFPGVISSVTGSKVAARYDDKKPNPFLIHYTQGDNYFTVKSLARAKETTGALNVVYNGHIYVIKLGVEKKGHSSVTFVLPKRPTVVSGGVGNVRQQVAVNPRVLLGCLTKAKGYHMFKKGGYPEQVANLGYHLANTEMDYSTHKILLKEVIRFDDKDTLVFHCQLKNKSEREIRYNPRDFAVNVGSKIFYSSISDASGVLPGGGSTTAFFAITGTKFGGRNNLNAKNDWRVILPVSQLPKILKEQADPVEAKKKIEQSEIKLPVVEKANEAVIKKDEPKKEMKIESLPEKKEPKKELKAPKTEKTLPKLQTLPDVELEQPKKKAKSEK